MKMEGKIREKLFRLLFPNEYITMTLLINSEKNLSRIIQKKEATIQILQRKMRRMERGKARKND